MSKIEKSRPKRKRPDKSIFADNLVRLMHERGITIRAAAELAGVSPATISDWTSGAAPASFESVAKLARGLGVSFEYLCLGTAEDKAIASIPDHDIFEEHPTSFEGIFKIQATRLVRKTHE